MARLRAFDWVLIVVLTGVWALLFARGIGDGLRTQRGFIDVRVSSARTGEYPTIQDGPTVVSELQLGDHVLAVDGQDLRGGTQLDFYDLATRAAREHGSTTIRAERDGRQFEARVGLTPRPGWWLGFGMQGIGMAVAVVILLRARDRTTARLWFVGLWAWVAANATMDIQQGWRATRGEVTLAGALVASFAVIAVWNAQGLTRSARPVPWPWRSLALVAGAWIATTAAIRTSLPHTWAQAVAATSMSTACTVVATLAGLTRAYLRSDALERRQIRWLVLGFYVAFVGNFVALELSLSGLRGTARVLAPLVSIGLYASILVSMVGYRWLDIDRLISATVSYTIVGVAVLGGALALVPRLAAATAVTLGIDAAAAQWLLTLGLIGAAIAVHHYLWPQLDRRIFADRHRRVSGLEALRDQLGQCSSAEEIWAVASERIDTLLEPESLVLYARDGDRFAARFARGRESSPPYEVDSVLVRALERRARPLAADASELDPFDRAALETLGVALVVPIHAGDRLIAFASLGAKRSGDIYTPAEKTQLGALASRCGEVLAPTAARPALPPQIFRHDGELWTLASGGKEVRLRDIRGLHYLAMLLREPGREFAVLDLARAASGLAIVNGAAPDPELRVARGLGDAGPVLDAQARTEYRARVVALDSELADAERCADLGRIERASAEREALLTELEAAAGGKRAGGSDSERARVAVTKAIKVALEKIAERHPELGAHLSVTVRRGYVCAYEPDPRVPVEWEL